MSYALSENAGLCFKCTAFTYKYRYFNIYGEIQMKEDTKSSQCSSASYCNKVPGNDFHSILVIFVFRALQLKEKLG